MRQLSKAVLLEVTQGLIVCVHLVAVQRRLPASADLLNVPLVRHARSAHFGMAVRDAANELLKEEAGLVLGQEAALGQEIEQLATCCILHHDRQVAWRQKYLHQQITFQQKKAVPKGW